MATDAMRPRGSLASSDRDEIGARSRVEGASDEDGALVVEVGSGVGQPGSAVLARAGYDTAPAISDRLTQLGGTSESHELTDEAVEAAGATDTAAV
jgi:hypothetical protein